MPRLSTALALLLATLALCGPLVAADRALLIGIDHYQHGPNLVSGTPGGVADARSLARFVERRYGFDPSAIRMLLGEQATSSNILHELRRWLVDGTEPGDRAFFFYAGHGSQLVDDDGDEADGWDETIAPYDVDPCTGGNQIRDDTFEELIAELSGRRAVLVFDSCHSGTISRGLTGAAAASARYLPRADQIAEYCGSRSIAGAYTVAPTRGAGRDLERIVEPQRLDRLSGVVVISAAGADQLAWPIQTAAGPRGALTHLFERSQRHDLPTVRQLRGRLVAGAEELRRQGALGGHQRPRVEVLSSTRLEDHPLFGGWQQAAAVALVNPLSKIRLAIATSEGKARYYEGEQISFRIDTDTAGYLYLLVFSEQRRATQLYPAPWDTPPAMSNRVPAGRHAFPRGGESFPIQAPYGSDVIVAVLARQPLPLDRPSYRWTEIFERLALSELRDALKAAVRDARQPAPLSDRGIGRRFDWQAATVTIESRRR